MQGERREVSVKAAHSGFGIKELVLVAVLLAAGAVLKLTVGSVVNLFGMKPNFIIAMYCLAILLTRPTVAQSAIIGLLAGAVCQLLPGTPYLNFISELAGAVCMAALLRLPMHLGRLNVQPTVATFISTVLSGGLFVVCLFVFLGATATSLVAYVPIVLCTALLNCVIVQALYVPMVKVLGREPATAVR
jgi:hypothetical protein